MSETNTGSPTPADISYQVMPNSNRPGSNAPLPPTVPGSSSTGGGGKSLYIIISIIVLALLGGLAYYFLGFNKKTATPQVSDQVGNSKLTSAFLQKYFSKDVCDDESTCGDNADVDNDGLSNYQELVAGTSPTDQDTDQDGLADGDEVNIYSTNPSEKYTDTRAIAKQNDYNDGSSINGGFDPLTPGDKFTETRLATIQAKISQYQLHVPTTTTLGLNPDGSKKASTTTSVNGSTSTGTSTGLPDETK